MYIKFCTSVLLAVSLVGCNTVQSLYQKGTDKTPKESTQPRSAKQTTVANMPLQQILKLQPDLSQELNQVSIQQVFNRAESPTAAQITVIQSGLLDDSVAAIRTVYQFKQQNERWTLANTEKSYQCARGAKNKHFQSKLCT